MGKSARVLGWEFRKTAQEMNVLLKEHGYLYGDPGAYGLTEKGEQFAQEQDHHRGTGGYSHYNRYWETRTWAGETAAALKADMAAAARPATTAKPSTPRDSSPVKDELPANDDSFEYMPMENGYDADERVPRWGDIAMQGAVVAVLAAAPHAKPFWDNRVKPLVWDAKIVPVVHKLQARFGRNPVPAASQDPVEVDD